MARKTLDIRDLIDPDSVGCRIADFWQTWETLRMHRKEQWKEIREYVYATDTRNTSNSGLPWKNTTTIPKICQIRDNLYANYMAAMFPKRKWLQWEGFSKVDQQKGKAIEDYMNWAVSQPWFKEEVGKLVLDYIDNGICLAAAEWSDERVEQPDKTTAGFVGPRPRRISPLDTVFNPTASNFRATPKIIRTIVSLGEVKSTLEAMSATEEDREQAEKIFRYMVDLRQRATEFGGDISAKDDYFRVDGFDSYRAYLTSDYAEILTFYGDLYDRSNDELLTNYIITVVDRHKVVYKRPNPSWFGYAPFYSSVWRVRQDNLWGMGPLDNLIGMQYRIDAVENMKADLLDLTVVPPIKIKGYVEDFKWGPGEKIVCGDVDSDVELLQSNQNALQYNIDIQTYEQRMEEMAGSPKEAMGFRTPGEKTAYEVQRLENAAARIFQNKIAQFEEQVTEPLLNAMLELAVRNMDETVIRIIDDETKIAEFRTLSKDDITGSGRIRPVAARHFAEQAEMVQNLNNFYASGLGMDPEVRMHLSSVKLAETFTSLLNIEDYEIFTPYVRLTEQSEAQKLQGVQTEEVVNNAMTPGLTMGDQPL